MMLLHVGLDDTDSRAGGCTTYVTYRLVKTFIDKGIKVLDYPRLIRLNPNVPWKTRGNGAVGLTIDHEQPEDIKNILDDELEISAGENNSAPSYVIITEHQRMKLKDIFSDAVNRIIPLDFALKTAEKHNLIFTYFHRKQGLIGAIAAASNLLEYGDYTFEILVYRQKEAIGTPRRIDYESVKTMDAIYSKYTFNNIDSNRILITPHSNDPVLFGIRGEDPKILVKASRLIKSEPPQGALVFKTNQGTDQHYAPRQLVEVCLGDSVSLRLRVSERPVTTLGGHVFVKLTDGVYSIKAAFYRETGNVRTAASMLIPGDIVTIFGGVKVSMDPIINVEKLLVEKLEKQYESKNPLCPNCLHPTESLGSMKGFRCKKCKKDLRITQKVMYPINRKLVAGLYLPPIKYFRHLMKPLKRYGKEKEGYSFKLDRFDLLF
jgi:tRNA(Ile2)-agmatinylcytidine synthase